jgi:hypothetical protein
VVEGVLENCEEAGVLGVVVGADAEEFAEFGEGFAARAGEDSSVAGGAGVATGSTVAVSGDPARVFGGGWCDGGVGEEAGSGGAVGHGVSL